MRYSLRNKDKIEQAYSPAFVKRLTDSLDKAFKSDLDIKHLVNENHPVLSINDEGHTCGIIIFYIISQKYDVYNLAFKEVIN